MVDRTLTPGTKAIPTSNLCDVCGKPATQSMLRDLFGKSDERRFVCSDHGFRMRDPADVAEIERLRAALETIVQMWQGNANDVDLTDAMMRVASEAMGNKPPAHETLSVAPFPYPTDRDGWICSMCHGWNQTWTRVCLHSHLPLEHEQHMCTSDCNAQKAKLGETFPDTLVRWVSSDTWRCHCKGPGAINHSIVGVCTDCGTLRPEKAAPRRIEKCFPDCVDDCVCDRYPEVPAQSEPE